VVDDIDVALCWLIEGSTNTTAGSTTVAPTMTTETPTTAGRIANHRFHFIVNLKYKKNRAVARKPRDAAAVLFCLKFADNIRYKFKSSQVSKAILQSSIHSSANQNLALRSVELGRQFWQFSEIRNICLQDMANVRIDQCHGALSCWRVTTSGYLAKNL